MRLVGIGSTVAATTIGGKTLLFPEKAVAQQRTDSERPQIVSPDRALQHLIDGNRRFVEGKQINPNTRAIALLKLLRLSFYMRLF